MISENKTTAFITGATSGIGLATAKAFARLGYALILCGRRYQRLERLRIELAEQVPVHTLVFDVRDANAVKLAIASLPDNFRKVDILLNNAGNAHGRDPIQTGSLSDWDAMIDINVKGLLYVSRFLIPQMVERKSGHIVNIGSIAGKETYPGGNVYCGSKAAVDAITTGMRQDLNPFGIKVTGINPGMVETEFSLVRFKGNEDQAKAVYEGFTPLSAEDVADVIVFVVTRPPHVVLADVLLLPLAQAGATQVKRN